MLCNNHEFKNSKTGAYSVTIMETYFYIKVSLSIYSRIKEIGNR